MTSIKISLLFFAASVLLCSLMHIAESAGYVAEDPYAKARRQQQMQLQQQQVMRQYQQNAADRLKAAHAAAYARAVQQHHQQQQQLNTANRAAAAQQQAVAYARAVQQHHQKQQALQHQQLNTAHRAAAAQQQAAHQNPANRLTAAQQAEAYARARQQMVRYNPPNMGASKQQVAAQTAARLRQQSGGLASRSLYGVNARPRTEAERKAAAVALAIEADIAATRFLEGRRKREALSDTLIHEISSHSVSVDGVEVSRKTKSGFINKPQDDSSKDKPKKT